MEEIVHIIPIGYEIDRIIKPFEGEHGFRANRVFLLSSIEGVTAPEDVLVKHEKYVQIVQKKLEEIGLIVKIVPTNLIDLLECFRKICSLILQEKQEGNLVYINMSGAGRLTSVAATLSGMVHDVKVYYVESDGYADNDPRMDDHGYTIVNDLSISHLENFQIKMPSDNALKILVEIMNRGHMLTIDIIEFLGSQGIDEFNVDYYRLRRSEKTRLIMKVNRNIIDKLESSGYIEKTKLGRENEIRITESGKYVASISGLIE